MTVPLLFEIGTEEIPSGYLEGARASILAKAPKLLAECGCHVGNGRDRSLQVYYTPRRLVLYANDFRRLDQTEEEKTGLLKTQAYENGRPTKALEGFLKSTGKKEPDVFFKETPRGTCVCVKIEKQHKPLRYFFETLPRQIDFPKLMRWDASRYTFTRPIRWTFAFIGKRRQTYAIGAIKSGHVSHGRRFSSGETIKVSGADFQTFEKLLARAHVVLNQGARIQKIKGFLRAIHNQNEELVNTAANLVEDPFPVKGVFPKEYLKLPREVLETCMAKQLKIFACYDSSGKLVNQFLAVINGKRSKTKLIATHYARILGSRLKDAQFFFDEDTKIKLEAKVAKLSEMVFLGSLGSYEDKTLRLEPLTEWLGKEAKLSQDVISRAKRAAHLAKADLTTHLVYEFTELQGIAGSEYARFDGEELQTARAISGHYLPRNLSEDFKDLEKNLNQEGALVGLCDRMDLLVGAFGLGIEPSGSQDPYGLRRAAGGIAKILRAHPFHFSLRRWIDVTYEQYDKPFKIKKGELEQKLILFLKERIIFELQLKAGAKEYEVLQAVLASNFDDMADVYERFRQLVSMIRDESFARACKVMERTANILKGIAAGVRDEVNPALFQDELENNLFHLLKREESRIFDLVASSKYQASAKAYEDAFYQPIHEFFDKVKVNTDNPEIRANRQALMKKIHQLYAAKVADLSKITNLS